MDQQTIAIDLVYPLFRSLSEEYKVRYVRNIWEQFENAIRSAAYTGKLTAFLENITKILPIEVQAQYINSVMSVIQSGDDEHVLNTLREETTYIVMMARIENKTRKDNYE